MGKFEIATGLKDKDDELRVATLLTCIGGDALSVYDGLKFQNDEDRKNIIKVLQVLEDFCIGQANEIYTNGIRSIKENKKSMKQLIATLLPYVLL